MLLPTAHAFFYKIAQELMSKHDPSDDYTNISVTSRWILSNLTNSLGHHLNCACKIKKHGTITYRSNSDLFLALSKALHKHQMNTSEEISGIPNVSDESRCNDNVLDEVAEQINTTFHAQIRKYLQEEKLVPFQFDQLNIDQPFGVSYAT